MAGRKKMDPGRKKVKMTLTVRPDTRACLDDIADEKGLSVSEVIEMFVNDYVEAKLALVELEREAREKAERKAKREARKAAKAAKENEQLPGQTELSDYIQ